MEKNTSCPKNEKRVEECNEKDEIFIEEAMKSMEKVNKQLKFNQLLDEASRQLTILRYEKAVIDGLEKQHGKKE